MWRSILMLLACYLSTACTPQPQAPLVVGTNVWPGYEALYFARDQGFVAPAAVHFIEYGSSTEVIRAFRNGIIDAAALTLDESLLLAQYVPDIHIVLVLDVSSGGDAILGGTQLANFAALRGRRVGVESTALGAYVLARALEINHMTPSDIYPVSIPASEQEQSYVRGDVDAVVTFEPVRSKLLARGAQVLFDSRQLPDEIVDVLVVRPDRMAAHRVHLQELGIAWFKALAAIRGQTDKAAPVLAAREGLSPQQFLLSLRGLNFPSLEENIRWLSGSAPRMDTQRVHLTQFMRSHALLEAQGAMPHADARLVNALLAGAKP